MRVGKPVTEKMWKEDCLEADKKLGGISGMIHARIICIESALEGKMHNSFREDYTDEQLKSRLDELKNLWSAFFEA